MPQGIRAGRQFRTVFPSTLALQMRKLEPRDMASSAPATKLRAWPKPGLRSSGSWRSFIPTYLNSFSQWITFLPQKPAAQGRVLFWVRTHEMPSFLRRSIWTCPVRNMLQWGSKLWDMLPTDKTWIKSWFYSEFAGSVPSRWRCQLFFCQVCAAVLWLEHRKEESRRGNSCLPHAFWPLP